MDKDTITGVILLAGVILLSGGLLIYSKITIDKIARKKLTSLRDILKEMKHGK